MRYPLAAFGWHPISQWLTGLPNAAAITRKSLGLYSNCLSWSPQVRYWDPLSLQRCSLNTRFRSFQPTDSSKHAHTSQAGGDQNLFLKLRHWQKQSPYLDEVALCIGHLSSMHPRSDLHCTCAGAEWFYSSHRRVKWGQIPGCFHQGG